MCTSQGFRQLKLVRGRNTTAFVEYDTVDHATAVHTSQQVRECGTQLQCGWGVGGVDTHACCRPRTKHASGHLHVCVVAYACLVLAFWITDITVCWT